MRMVPLVAVSIRYRCICHSASRDSGTNAGLVYSIIGTDSDFQINSTFGIVSVRRSGLLDLEVTGMIPVQVRVQDTGTPPLSSLTLVSLHGYNTSGIIS